MDLNKFFSDNYEVRPRSRGGLRNRSRITCVDGFSLSVQASETHCCTPRDNYGPYSMVEVGFPSKRVKGFMQFAINADEPLDTIYAWVPIEIVEKAIESHGGIKE